MHEIIFSDSQPKNFSMQKINYTIYHSLEASDPVQYQTTAALMYALMCSFLVLYAVCVGYEE